MKFDSISELSMLAIIGMVIVCYKSSINKFIGSNCVKFKCFGVSIEREPLSERAALEVIEHLEHGPIHVLNVYVETHLFIMNRLIFSVKILKECNIFISFLSPFTLIVL